MASVLATLAALAVIGLLFALDPGGAIAESGFPDFREMDWKQLTAWGFRTIGVGVGLLLVLWLWVKYSPKQEIKHQDPLELGTRRRPGMSAAAVSVLEDRVVSDRTLLAAISRDVPARHVASRVRRNRERPTGTSCRSRVPRSLTGSS